MNVFLCLSPPHRPDAVQRSGQPDEGGGLQPQGDGPLVLVHPPGGGLQRPRRGSSALRRRTVTLPSVWAATASCSSGLHSPSGLPPAQGASRALGVRTLESLKICSLFQNLGEILPPHFSSSSSSSSSLSLFGMITERSDSKVQQKSKGREEEEEGRQRHARKHAPTHPSEQLCLCWLGSWSWLSSPPSLRLFATSFGLFSDEV